MIEPSQVNPKVLPEYYVVLCARRYAAAAEALKLAATDIERSEHQSRLSYLLQSGLLEARLEQERRQRRFPDDFRKALIEKDGSIISRAITSEEDELLRYAYSVPCIASIYQLSVQAMGDLADMFEGWSQSDLTDPVNVARLLGWADGLRCLADAVSMPAIQEMTAITCSALIHSYIEIASHALPPPPGRFPR